MSNTTISKSSFSLPPDLTDSFALGELFILTARECFVRGGSANLQERVEKAFREAAHFVEGLREIAQQ